MAGWIEKLMSLRESAQKQDLASKLVLSPKNALVDLRGNAVIPEGTRELFHGAFEGKMRLNCVVLPKSVKKVDSRAFAKCVNLKEVHLNERLEVLESNVFNGCVSLKTLVFPDSVREVRAYAFYETNLGWDILPQSYEYVPAPTVVSASQMMTDTIRLIDTPGYSLLWKTVPEDTAAAVSKADMLIVMLSEELAEDKMDIPSVDPEWEARRAREAELLAGLLANCESRDIFFVIPYDAEDWPEGNVPVTQAVRLAQERFASFSCRGRDGFFCIDPMKALIGAIEADDEAVDASGILPLKVRLTG